MATVELTIKGMECDACVGHVTRALQDLPGVVSAKVTLAENKAAVTFDASQTSLEDMRAAILDEGYDVAR